MKLLLKIYLVGQLIALPFMVGAIGNAFSGSDSPSTPAASSPSSALQQAGALADIGVTDNSDLCDALNKSALNPVQDDIQQLKYITGQLYGDDAVEECAFSRSP